MNYPISPMRPVNLSEAWPSEVQDFTPWLAQDENLALLGDSLGIELELDAQDKSVGPFRADILCRNTEDASWVLIENQLQPADESHLGRLITFAAGLKAASIVWVAAKFDDSQKATLEWLNHITHDEIRFYGIEVELWRIGDSPAAARFNLVVKPNEWQREIASAIRGTKSQDLSETKRLQLQFWTDFRDYLVREKSSLKPYKAAAQHWMNFGVGRSGFLLGALLNSVEGRVGIELTISHPDAKSYFKILHAQKDKIEQEMGFSPEWLEMIGRKSCRVVHYWRNTDPLDPLKWPHYQRWMKEHLEKMRNAFRSRLGKLDLAAESEREEVAAA